MSGAERHVREYQLVVQVPTSTTFGYDEVIDLEDRLIDVLGDKIDGHDLGSGEANIFALTATPNEDFAVIRDMVSALPGVGAAYRDVDDDDYTRIWPPASNAPFTVA